MEGDKQTGMTTDPPTSPHKEEAETMAVNALMALHGAEVVAAWGPAGGVCRSGRGGMWTATAVVNAKEPKRPPTKKPTTKGPTKEPTRPPTKKPTVKGPTKEPTKPPTKKPKAMTGKDNSAPTRAKISKAMMGRKHSAAHCVL